MMGLVVEADFHESKKADRLHNPLALAPTEANRPPIAFDDAVYSNVAEEGQDSWRLVVLTLPPSPIRELIHGDNGFDRENS